jgi:aspartyl-tRNA(Asn)/glutamyl-tRNA(Gln) amidotransferase subunit A
MTAIHDRTVKQLAVALRAKEVSAVETAQHFLARMKSHESLGAFLAVNEDVTLAQARASDARLHAGSAGPLEGVPLAHKDILVTKDFPSTAHRLMQQSCANWQRRVLSRWASSTAMNLQWAHRTKTRPSNPSKIPGVQTSFLGAPRVAVPLRLRRE